MSKKILANDGISKSGIEALKAGGYSVSTVTIPQAELIETINSENYVGIIGEKCNDCASRFN